MIYLLKLPFEKAGAKAQKSYFKGEFLLYIDESSEILDIDVNFTNVRFDCMSTASHFTSKSVWWRFKDELLKKWNILHTPRPDGKNDILNLNQKQLDDLNDQYNIYFRNKRKHKITIKELDGVISGSNSPGELKNPKATAFSLIDLEYKNFATAITKLWTKDNFIKNEWKRFSKEITLKEYFQNFPWIEEIFKAYQKSVDPTLHKLIKDNIKDNEEFKKYNAFRKTVNIKIKERRNDFQSRMDELLEKISSMPIKIAKKQKEYRNFERAHIMPVSHIKRQIFKEWIHLSADSALVDDYLDKVNDQNNGIWLSPTDHRDFDRGYAYISQDWSFVSKGKKPRAIEKEYINYKRAEYAKYHKNKIYGKGL